MINQLSFDFKLIWSRKRYLIFAFILNIAYFIVGGIIFSQNTVMQMISTLAVCTINTYILLTTIYSTRMLNNQSASNFTICIYFPMKRKYFFWGNAVITLLLVFIQMIVTFITTVITAMISSENLDWDMVRILLLITLGTILFYSSIACLCSYSSVAIRISLSISICMTSGFIGGFTSLNKYGINTFDLSCPIFFIVGGIFIAIWILSVLLAQFIAKHVYV